jgi:hypothetical protein
LDPAILSFRLLLNPRQQEIDLVRVISSTASATPFSFFIARAIASALTVILGDASTRTVTRLYAWQF